MIPLRQESEDCRGALEASDIARLSTIARSDCGITLGDDKADFLIARLSRRLSVGGFDGYQAYCDFIESPGGAEERRVFLESIATHTTSFFREAGHFEWLANSGISSLREHGAGIARDLTVWSAACSTGQELYSALMTIAQENLSGRQDVRFAGTGTDLSRDVVRSAQQAVYSDQEISGLSQEMRQKFLLVSKKDPKVFRVCPDIRRKSDWQVANLTQRQSLMGMAVDVIFIRNVLIYFDEATQARVLENVISCLRPGGFILTGHSETSVIRRMGLKTIRPTIYQKAL